MKKLSCVILACGAARRFGENKLLANFEGKPMFSHILGQIPQEYFSEILLVTRYSKVAEEANRLGISGLRCVWSKEEQAGIAYTIKLGIANVDIQTAGRMFCVADQPFLGRASLLRLARTFLLQKEGTIVALSFAGKRGNPVIFPSAYDAELRDLREGESGSTVIQRHLNQLVLVEAEKQLELEDIDYKEDIFRFQHNKKLSSLS